jgi:hypothetical protein
MDLDNSIIIDLWELMSDGAPNNKKEELAIRFVTLLAREGVEKGDFNAVRGEDDHLDNAVDHYFSDESNDSDDYDGSYSYDEDD